MNARREQRPRPFWRSVGYLLFALAWTIVFLAITFAFWFSIARVAQGAVGPFGGTPIGGIIVIILLGAPAIGYLCFLSPLLTASQAALGFVLFFDSLGGEDADPPLAINTGRRIPLFAPAQPTRMTARLVAASERARVPGAPLLLTVFVLGAACIATVVVIGWN